jgi:hypothetical protein
MLEERLAVGTRSIVSTRAFGSSALRSEEEEETSGDDDTIVDVDNEP